MYVYFSRDTGILYFAILKIKIMEVRKVEEEIAKNNVRKIPYIL